MASTSKPKLADAIHGTNPQVHPPLFELGYELIDSSWWKKSLELGYTIHYIGKNIVSHSMVRFPSYLLIWEEKADK
jgi:hypothetical protein